MRRLMAGCVLLTAVAARSSSQEIDLSRFRIVDLSHDLGVSTTLWPGSKPSFRLDTLTAGRNAQGNYAALFFLATPEHFGTHMDAPHHFSETGASTDRVPLAQLVAAAVVLDVRDSAGANRDYTLTVRDVQQYERHFGRIPPGAIVLLRTGYDARWGNRASYFGWDSTLTPVQLHFPGVGVDAARFLVEKRKIAAVGVDVASTDAGAAGGFPVHRILGEAGVPGFENLADLGALPPRGATVIALTPRIVGGSGGPLRAIALVPKTSRVR